MKNARTAVALLPLLFLGACSNLDRSRALGDPTVPASTIAQQVCGICHGISGRSENPKFPNLAAQPQEYLATELKEFRSQSRRDPAGYEHMWGLSHHLSDEQIEGLAGYFAKQEAPRSERRRDPALVARGHDIFEGGLPDRNIPACKSCHGREAMGGADFPRLAGQHADYLEKQLVIFQETDDRPHGELMKHVAERLTRAEIHAVAEFLEGLSAAH